MGPKKGRRKNDEDEELDKLEANSKWAKLIDKNAK